METTKIIVYTSTVQFTRKRPVRVLGGTTTPIGEIGLRADGSFVVRADDPELKALIEQRTRELVEQGAETILGEHDEKTGVITDFAIRIKPPDPAFPDLFCQKFHTRYKDKPVSACRAEYYQRGLDNIEKLRVPEPPSPNPTSAPSRH